MLSSLEKVSRLQTETSDQQSLLTDVDSFILITNNTLTLFGIQAQIKRGVLKGLVVGEGKGNGAIIYNLKKKKNDPKTLLKALFNLFCLNANIKEKS